MKLRVTWDGSTTEFGPGETFTIGRDDDASVTIRQSTVSRHHLDFSFRDTMWVFQDRSSNGTYINGEPAPIGAIGGPVDLHLGSPTGPRVRVEPIVDTADPPTRTAPADPGPGPTAAGGSTRTDMAAPTDRELRLELGGRSHRITAGRPVVVGSDLDVDIHCPSPLVSAQHCAFTHDGEHWWIEDLGSERGTWVDGRRVKRHRVEGAFFVMLGDDDAGEPIRVIAAGVHHRHQPPPIGVLAGAALVVALLITVIGVVVWSNRDADRAVIDELRSQLEEERQRNRDELAAAQDRADEAIEELNRRGGAGNSPAELSAARLATALLSIPDRDGNVIGRGSGALVSADGFVLTNIHVVRPALEFQRTGDPAFRGLEDPEEILVSFSTVDGGPADRYFVAEQHSVHPAHDAAVIRIVSPLSDSGTTMDDLPAPLPLGRSGTLLAGDGLAVVGFPNTAFTDRVSVALSNFQSFQPCIAGSVIDTRWGCLRDYDEGYLNLAGETLEGGSSGGPIVRRGEIIGIQLGVFGDQGDLSGQNLGVPIDLITAELDIG